MLSGVLLIFCCLALNTAAGMDRFSITPRGARYQELQVGAGPTVESGDVVTMHFTGWLDDNGRKGRAIYNTRTDGRPVSFVVGTGRVMPGWNEGVIGMQAGGKRLLLLPPALGYGQRAIDGIIPANASLIFVIDVIAVEKRP